MRRSPAAAGGHGVGIDIGDSAVRLVDIVGSRLLRWSVAPLPPGAMASGAVRDAAAVADAVRRVLSASGAAGQSIISGVPGAACFIRRMQFPDLAPKDLQRAVRWEAERLLPYPFADAVVDYDVLVRREEQGKPVTDVVLVGARAEVVDGLRAAVEAGGARLGALDAVPLARLRAFRREVTAPGVLLVHLGTQWTELTAADEHGFVFTRTVSTAEPGTRTVLDEVVRSVRFFETQAGTQITKILLTGAGAEAPNAVEMFAAADLPPATLVDPLAALQRDPSVSPPPALTLAAAAGLATRGAGTPAAREVPWR